MKWSEDREHASTVHVHCWIILWGYRSICMSIYWLIDWLINVKVAQTMEYYSGEKRKRKSYNLQKHEARGHCIKQSKPDIQR